uniref:Uncharacterized protein n=1 Tax=Pithovirus LCPAC401 TaxID=2506595 RepID=A0A481Z9N8_9VIRU|nr:MAG: uncharacterized protein LCPAC401_02520 [Pithovirus LCPAC401]
MLNIFVVGDESLKRRFMDIYGHNATVIMLADLTIFDIDNRDYGMNPTICNGIICFRVAGDNNIITNTKQPVVYYYEEGEDNPLDRILDLISPMTLSK